MSKALYSSTTHAAARRRARPNHSHKLSANGHLNTVSTDNRSVVSLRVIGDSIDPVEVTALLRAKPTYAYKRGSTRLTALGKEVANSSGYWSLAAQEQVPEDLNSQITEILGKLTQDLQVWQSLSARYRIDLFCGLFMERSNEGLSLKPATLRLVAERGIEIGIDLYAPDESEEDARTDA